MTTFTARIGGASAFLLAVVVPLGRGQCPQWMPGFGWPGVGGLGVSASVDASIIYDDGTGPALYIGGGFTSAGEIAAQNLARWNGTSWSAVGGGVTAPPQELAGVSAFAIFDDGTGSALYVAGVFDHAGSVPANSIAKWNGSSWSALGSGIGPGGVSALAVFDDGTGPALFAAGAFHSAGGSIANYFAKWDGSAWSALLGAIDDNVYGLQVFDDGSGPALYLGGRFTMAGGVHASSLVRWDGTNWSDVGGGTNRSVLKMAVFDDGRGPALYVGGDFELVGGMSANAIARWDGTNWETVGSGVGSDSDAIVGSMLTYDDGTGPALYVGGAFREATGAPGNNIARWDGSAWSSLGAGVSEVESFDGVWSLCSFDSSAGPLLYVGGRYDTAGTERASGIASWHAGTWSSLSDGSVNAMSGTVEAFVAGDLGNGQRLFAGGALLRLAGSAAVQGVAEWDGSTWSSLGPGLSADEVSALAIYNDGSGPALYVAGHNLPLYGNPSGHIVRWNGSTWSTLQSGVSGGKGGTQVLALTVYDDGQGPALYAGGFFSQASGVGASNIARWNGSSWSAVGYGLVSVVYALAVYDDGSGPKLVAGGWYNNDPNVFVWDGSTWSLLGSGLDGAVRAFAVIQDGARHDLYAAGIFPSSGGSPLSNIARWDGSSWSSVGRGLCDLVEALGVYDDGGGPALYAGGRFTCSGAQQLGRIAKWDGAAWHGLAGGMDWEVHALLAAPSLPGSGSSLFAGGEFSLAGSVPSGNIAEWKGCATSAGVPFCFGDGSAVPCPCANSGAAGHGCENSIGTGGAVLAASGTTSPDTILLTSSGELPSALTVFLQGTTTVGPFVYGDGLRCTGGALKRLYSKNAVGGVAAAPQGVEPSITARSAAKGDPLYPGFTRRYQTYYRDPNPSFCPSPTGSTFNASNGVSIVW